MNVDSGGKASDSKGENSEKEHMALGVGDVNRVRSPLSVPTAATTSSAEAGF